MIFDVYNRVGHRQYGESVTELQHALQTATFAMQFNSSDDVVVASLLHDYGHLQHDEGEDVANRGIDMRHEDLGAIKLKHFFGAEILEPIRLHVAAKRYLCHKSQTYVDGLSPASRLSLEIQGGPMSDSESIEFEFNPYYKSAVELRRFDDMGKVPGMETPTLESFYSLVLSFVR
ncbi:MAG: HD domain-containing protein [Planctomycetes bacterium]|nr:HD domain-containing protein [Planctomycetota bacterium]